MTEPIHATDIIDDIFLMISVMALLCLTVFLLIHSLFPLNEDEYNFKLSDSLFWRFYVP